MLSGRNILAKAASAPSRIMSPLVAPAPTNRKKRSAASARPSRRGGRNARSKINSKLSTGTSCGNPGLMVRRTVSTVSNASVKLFAIQSGLIAHALAEWSVRSGQKATKPHRLWNLLWLFKTCSSQHRLTDSGHIKRDAGDQVAIRPGQRSDPEQKRCSL